MAVNILISILMQMYLPHPTKKLKLGSSPLSLTPHLNDNSKTDLMNINCTSWTWHLPLLLGRNKAIFLKVGATLDVSI